MEDSDAVRCPYIPDHVMHIGSLLTHLNRCKATNKHLFKTCIYSSLHVIPKEKYKDHLRTCPNKGNSALDDEEWEKKRIQTLVQKKDHDDSNFSSSRDEFGCNSIQNSNGRTEFSFSNEQGSFYGKQENERSYFTEKEAPIQQKVEKNYSLDFSFNGNDNQNFSGKMNREDVQSQRETEATSNVFTDLSFAQTAKSYNPEPIEDEDVLELLSQFENKGIAPYNEIRGAYNNRYGIKENPFACEDKLGNDLMKFCMTKNKHVQLNQSRQVM